VYDPSQQIRKDLDNAAMTVEQGFQNVLDKKKQEYDFVNKVYQDAELMKKDLNLHNYELITKRSNDLIKETASVIKEKGKVDFTKLGELKNKVREIADAKKNSELSVQAFGDITKMVQANAANMRNPIETVTKMMAKLKDEKYLFSPRNMYETAMEDYKDGLDYAKIIRDKLFELQKKGVPVQGQFDAPDGSLIEYKGIVPFGFKFDDKSKKLVPDVRVDEQTGQPINPIEQITNSIDPELWQGYMKQVVGFGQMLNPNPSDYAADLIDSTLGGSISYVTKKDALARQNERLTVGVKAQTLEEKMRKSSPEELAKEAEKEAFDRQYKEKGMQLREQSLGISQKRLGLAQEDSQFKRQEKQNNPTKPGIIKLSSPNSFYTKTNFNGKEIKAVGNSRKGGIELVPKSGGKSIILDNQDKINEFYNNVDKETRTAIDQIMTSPQYVPIGGKKTQPVSTKTMKNTENL
jgi:hypothetical protein